MVNCIKKFCFCDRWYYFNKVENNILFYETKKGDYVNNSLFQFNIDDKTITLITIKNKHTIDKLEISDITMNNIVYNYTQFIPDEIEVNDNIYVNVLLNFRAEIEGFRLISEEVKFVPVKRMKKMCYCEPVFPLNTYVDARLYDINSDKYNKFQKMYWNCSSSYSFIKEKLLNNNEDDVEVIGDFDLNRNSILDVPKEIYIYSANYVLYSDDVDTYYYIEDKMDYSKDDKNNTLKFLTIKVDLYSGKTKMIEIKNGSLSLIQIYRNEKNNNNVTFRYVNKKKLDVNINGILYEKCKIHMDADYDENNKINEYSINIVSKGTSGLNLKAHPIYVNTYLDDEGNEYHLGNGNFALDQFMVYSACNIINFVDQSFFKEDLDKVKKIGTI